MRRNRNFLRILVYPGSTRNKVKGNGVEIECTVVATRWAHGDSYNSSHPFLYCDASGHYLWRLGLPQDKQRASATPSSMNSRIVKKY